MYRLLFRLLLVRLPAEWVHRVAFVLLRLFAALPGVRWLLRRWLAPSAPELRVRALGREFPGPVGLAAGFDKDARGYEALAALGFGFIEVGTVTPEPQPGNPRPRMWRLTADRALLNRLGFNNRGSAAAAARLGRPRSVLLGVNIGKNKMHARRGGHRRLREGRRAPGPAGRLPGGERQLAQHARPARAPAGRDAAGCC